MTDEKLSTALADVIGPDIEIVSGIYPISIPQLGKQIKVLIIHSDEAKPGDNMLKGWHFSLETTPHLISEPFDDAKSALLGALEAITKTVFETELISAENSTLH
jgi:hypothetical protein